MFTQVVETIMRSLKTESHHPSQTESTEKIVDFWSAESLKTVMKSERMQNVSISNLLKYGG